MFGLSVSLSAYAAGAEPAAPSGLAVSITPASLTFGQVATANVTVYGFPFPDLALQWTLDGADIPGANDASYFATAEGALRVRVTATNSEGSDGPVTSDPVTVTALAPDGFSELQWSVGPTGTSGEIAITLGELPFGNGGAITSVERRLDGGSWVALAGVALATPYAIGSLTDDQPYDVRIRAVNSAGAGPESDLKTATPETPAVAPSGLTVAIAEATLAFGDTATADVTVAGAPTPDLEWQWTLDGGDVEGQTGATFEGVPVGALRVRVTATNTEGSDGPVTSDPVTVTALAPGAFSAGQWAADATGSTGEVEITLSGLPSANGAAISSVERQVDDGSWTALAGISLATPYAITGLTDDQLYSFRLRAVNAIGAGAASDTKMETPRGASAPDTVGDNGWTFQAVPASDDLEAAILVDTTGVTHLAFDLDDDVKPEAAVADLANGPVEINPPTISGANTLGATWTATPAVWATSTGVTSTAGQWFRNGSPIDGATGLTYDLTGPDSDTDLTYAETATDAQGESDPAVSAAAAIPTIIDLYTHAVTLDTRQWHSIDLFEIAGAASFTLESGTAPTGMTFMADVGILEGAPTAVGVTVLTFYGDAATPSRTTVTLTVRRAYDAVQGGAIRRTSTLGLTAPANPERATYATRFTIPVAHATEVTLMRGFNAYQVRVRGADGRIRVNVFDTTNTQLFEVTSTALSGDWRDGVEHELVIAADLDGGSPTLTIWMDGVELEKTGTVVAGDIATEATFYSVAAGTDGTSQPIPVDGSIRWSYVEFGAARVPADFANGPENAGSPHLLFGGSLTDWSTGVNHGSEADWTVQHGTWLLVSTDVDDTPLAFQGALGFGRFTTGGIHETIRRVTNTSDNPATSGSLPWAIAQAEIDGGAYILIETEGILELTENLILTAPNVTVDARRQPGLGFVISGGTLWARGVDNVLLRHLRGYAGSSPDGNAGAGRDCFTAGANAIDTPQERFYMENCDALFAVDEAVAPYGYKSGSPVTAVTIHNCLIAEALHESLHVDVDGTGLVDNHSKAVVVSSITSNVTLYGCLLASCDDRMPRTLSPAMETISTIIANYGSTSIQVVAATAFADFINCFFMLGGRPGNPTGSSSKWITGTTSTTLEVVYESGCFTGAWTLAGGFDDAAMIDNWRNQTSSSTYMDPTALDNPALFTKSGAAVGALSYSDAFTTLGARVGSRNVNGELHPFAARILGYVTEAVPFSTGWHGAPFEKKMLPDELRAIGANVSVPGAGQMTVTLPAAPAAVAGRAWTGVSVEVLDAYDDLIAVGDSEILRNANTWASDAVEQAGSLTGGAVAFSGLPAGFYVARVTWTATGGAIMRAYQGRPVEVGA